MWNHRFMTLAALALTITTLFAQDQGATRRLTVFNKGSLGQNSESGRAKLAAAVLAPFAGSAELHELQRWVGAKFDGAPRSAPPSWGLAVLTNFDELCLNARMGRPLTIGKAEYSRGIFCHATSKVAVRLPAPGKTFSALIGVDSNPQTIGGRGSIVFSVSVADKEAFRSTVMREGVPAERVNLDLGGATELLLEVSDAGDGNSCDQADWVEAKIELADGRILWLGDLPIIKGQLLPTISTDLPFSFNYGGQSSAALLKEWRLDRQIKKLDDQRTERLWTWTDPKSKLALRCVAIEYHDFPTVEWTLYFTNGVGSSRVDLQACKLEYSIVSPK